MPKTVRSSSKGETELRKLNREKKNGGKEREGGLTVNKSLSANRAE